MKASQALAAAIATHRPDRRNSNGGRGIRRSPRVSTAKTTPERDVERANIAARAAAESAARLIQLHWRRKRYRRAWRGIEARWWRHTVSLRKQAPTLAVAIIQRWWKQQIIICRQHAACRIQSFLRMLATPQTRDLVRAAQLIQESFRRHRKHCKYIFLYSRALRIQKYWRGFFTRRRLTKELDQLRLAKGRWLFNMSRGMFQPLWTHRIPGASPRGSTTDLLDAVNQGDAKSLEARSPQKALSAKDVSVEKRTFVPESRILRWVRLGSHTRRTSQRKIAIRSHSLELPHGPASPSDAADMDLGHALSRTIPGNQIWSSANVSPSQSPATSPNSFAGSTTSPCKPILVPEDVDTLLTELLGRGFLSCVGQPAESSAYCDSPCSDLDTVRARLLYSLPPCHEVRSIFRVVCGDTAIAAYSAVKSSLGPEYLLWHGTSWESVANVAHYGFNRAYAYSGKHGAKLGKGCYFATDPGYAMRFCGRSAPSRPVFLAGVLPGRFTRGKDGIIEPPLANEGGARFDSTVDDLSTPKVFCVFKDFQALPLYLAEVVRA